jgi:plastocyanin
MTRPPRGSRVLAAISILLASGAAGCGDEPARAHTVTIDRFEYQPPTLAVNAGDTVVWDNRDLVPHTATSQALEVETGGLAPGASASQVIGRKGTYEYVCRFHPAMTGRLVVH